MADAPDSQVPSRKNLVSVDKVAQALNVTVRRVNQLAKEGVLPREGRGEYDLGRCMLAYIRYLQKALAQKGTMDGEGEVFAGKTERARLAKAQAELAEIDVAKARGLLVPLEVSDRRILAHLTVIRQRFQQLPAAVAHELEGLDRIGIKMKLGSAVREVLMALSTGDDVANATREIYGGRSGRAVNDGRGGRGSKGVGPKARTTARSSSRRQH